MLLCLLPLLCMYVYTTAQDVDDTQEQYKLRPFVVSMLMLHVRAALLLTHTCASQPGW